MSSLAISCGGRPLEQRSCRDDAVVGLAVTRSLNP